jgi:hypothetical protein
VQNQPFARQHWRPYDAARKPTKKQEAERKRKNPNDVLTQLYEAAGTWQRIDGDWLGTASDLALKIDGDVNNTSLALALELAEKDVLLFPADAQVGNWESWGDQTYPASDDTKSQQLKIDDLLSRTIFYKVGHHASHNATLRDRGLELMTDTRLCAMIPVVRKTAREQKNKNAVNGWAMPYADLFERLQQRTDNRILTGDGDCDEEIGYFKKSIFSLSYGPDPNVKDPTWVQLDLPV